MNWTVSSLFAIDAPLDESTLRAIVEPANGEAVEPTNTRDKAGGTGEFQYSTSEIDRERGDLETAVRTLANASWGVLSFQIDHLDLKLEIHDHMDLVNAPAVSLRSPETPFKNSSAAGNVDTYLNAVGRICSAIKPIFGLGQSKLDLYEEHGYIPTVDEVRNTGLEFLFWLNYFSLDLPENPDKKILLNAPAWRVVEFDGGVLIVTTPNPISSEYSEAEHASKPRTAEYLGLEEI